MTLPGQRVQPERYQVIPRTLIFILKQDEILLVKVAADRGAWAGLYNGLGGHIERGENPHAAAVREVQEEAGITPSNLRLCGIIVVDTGSSPGIGMHVFVGQSETSALSLSDEGVPSWIPLSQLDTLPLVADLPAVIPEALEAYRTSSIFCGLTTFSDSGEPELLFMS